MDEYACPAVVDRPTGNLTDLVVDNATQAPHKVVFSRRAGDRWLDVTCREFLTEVSAVAKGLISSGIEPGDRVGLMSRTRYEWTLLDFAIWFSGAVTVPVYETSSAEQVQWILSDSGAKACFVETVEHEALVGGVRDSLADLDHVWTIDRGALDSLTGSGIDVDDATLETRRNAVAGDALATIIYTSGTTGRPKGCELTHLNFLSEVANIVQAAGAESGLSILFHEEDAATLLFLPLAHVFARVVEVGCVMARARVGHTADVKNLLADLEVFKPTFILSVPRVFEKVYNSAAQKAEVAGKGKIFHTAADTAIAFSEALDEGGPGLGLRAKHAVFDKLVYSRLRAALGGKTRWSVSGGAPLGTRLGHFFRGIGLTIVEGYGLTETTAAATVNRPDHNRIGTVGRPLPGVTVRIAGDGEILIKGGIVFRGYYNNPAATAEALTDGWFHSGDIGELDGDGYLRITGRKKELLVTAGGKNVAPAALEDRLRAHRLVSQCMVVGDAQPYIACLVTLDEEVLPVWLEQHGKPAMSVADAAVDPQVLAEIQVAVDQANASVSKAEAIKRFKVLPVDWTEETGELTPSLKLKRNVVMKEHADDVDALYS
ncbi:MAG: long-chain acyl-CoA synthetase [Actinomycetota bacterium]|jgi:long-chain acyl-CoA synthetase|nr:long-chain acyl-CoA synthetase [Actinomycetota bacterium]